MCPEMVWTCGEHGGWLTGKENSKMNSIKITKERELTLELT